MINLNIKWQKKDNVKQNWPDIIFRALLHHVNQVPQALTEFYEDYRYFRM